MIMVLIKLTIALLVSRVQLQSEKNEKNQESVKLNDFYSSFSKSIRGSMDDSLCAMLCV